MLSSCLLFSILTIGGVDCDREGGRYGDIRVFDVYLTLRATCAGCDTDVRSVWR